MIYLKKFNENTEEKLYQPTHELDFKRSTLTPNEHRRVPIKESDWEQLSKYEVDKQVWMTPMWIKGEIAMISVDTHRNRARVIETEDEWIYIDIQDKLYSEEKKYFKCDQWDGAIQCLKDNRLIEIENQTFWKTNETLKSYDIELVERQFDKFFQSRGFNKKEGVGSNVKLPYYSIISDRYYMKRQIDELENPTPEKIELYKKHNVDMENALQRHKQALEEHKKGDIYIYTSPSKKITPQLIDDLLHLIESVGYFVATSGSFEKKLKDKTKIREHLLKKGRGGIPNGISISIEPYYDTQVQFDGQYLYHVTPKRVLDKVMKFGLNPKSKNTVSFYPERIYLSPDDKFMDAILPQLKDKKKDEEYVKLRIKNYPELKLYKDVRFKGGFYTYNSINPKYIEVIT
jgi:hypothetical protein